MSTINLKQFRNNVYDTRYCLYVDGYTTFPTLEQTGSPARPFSTIQQALNFGLTNTINVSWTIIISNGVYSENLNLTDACNFIFEGITALDSVINGNISWVISKVGSRVAFSNLGFNNFSVSGSGTGLLKSTNCILNDVSSSGSAVLDTVLIGLEPANIDQFSTTPLSSVGALSTPSGNIIATNTKFLNTIVVNSLHADGSSFSGNISLHGTELDINNSVWLSSSNIAFTNSTGNAYFDGASAFNFSENGGSLINGSQTTRTSDSFQPSGDLSGSASSQTVSALQGVPLDTSHPEDGYSLVYSSGSGSIIFKSVSGGTGGTGISSSDHEVLRQAIHFIAGGGPGKGFGTSLYKEVLPTGSPFPTQISWYTDSSKTSLIVRKQLSYNTNKTINTITWLIYSSNGISVLETIEDTINYDTTGVFEVSRTRAIS